MVEHVVRHMFLIVNAAPGPLRQQAPADRDGIGFGAFENLLPHGMICFARREKRAVKGFIDHSRIRPVLETAHHGGGDVARAGPHGNSDGLARTGVHGRSLSRSTSSR